MPQDQFLRKKWKSVEKTELNKYLELPIAYDGIDELVIHHLLSYSIGEVF